MKRISSLIVVVMFSLIVSILLSASMASAADTTLVDPPSQQCSNKINRAYQQVSQAFTASEGKQVGYYIQQFDNLIDQGCLTLNPMLIKRSQQQPRSQVCLASASGFRNHLAVNFINFLNYQNNYLNYLSGKKFFSREFSKQVRELKKMQRSLELLNLKLFREQSKSKKNETSLRKIRREMAQANRSILRLKKSMDRLLKADPEFKEAGRQSNLSFINLQVNTIVAYSLGCSNNRYFYPKWMIGNGLENVDLSQGLYNQLFYLNLQKAIQKQNIK